MGWWDSLGAWGQKAKAIWNSPVITNVVSKSLGFSFKTLIYGLEMVPAAGKTFYSAFNDTKTRRFFKDITIMTASDLSWLIASNVLDDWVMQYGEELANDYGLPQPMMTVTQYGTKFVKTQIYIHFMSRFIFRSVALTAHLKKLHNVKLPAEYNIVKPELDEDKPFNLNKSISSSVIEVLDYYLVKAIISGVSYLPYAGWPLQQVLTVAHNGRYVVSMGLGNNSREARQHYLKNHPELPVAFGLAHWLTTHVGAGYVESMTGIPRKYIEGSLSDMLLLLQISLAVHFKFSETKYREESLDYNPVALLEMFFDYCLMTVATGIKNNPPQLPLSVQQSDIWVTLRGYAKSSMPYLPSTKDLVKSRILPKLFSSHEAMKEDAVIGNDWRDFIQAVKDFLEGLEQAQEKWYVALAKGHKTRTASLLESKFGVSPTLTILVLTLMNNKSFMNDLRHLKLHLIALDPVKASQEVQVAYLLQKGVEAKNGFQNQPQNQMSEDPESRNHALKIMEKKPSSTQALSALGLFSSKKPSGSIAVLNLPQQRTVTPNQDSLGALNM